MDLGLDTGLRNLPIVVKRMQRRPWGRIVPAFWDGEELRGWGITNLRLATTRFTGELSSAPGRLAELSGPAGRDPWVVAVQQVSEACCGAGEMVRLSG